MKIFLIALNILFLACLAPASAQQQNGAQKSLGVFSAWKAYSYKENDEPVCYMVKTVAFPAPKNKKFKRGPAYLMITDRPGETSKDVISYIAGYNFKSASSITLTIGKDSFDLFANKDTAWSRDSKTDHAIAAALRNAATVKIVGTPAQTGLPLTVDTLDIKGAAAAYQAINIACGYEKAPAKTAPAVKKRK